MTALITTQALTHQLELVAPNSLLQGYHAR